MAKMSLYPMSPFEVYVETEALVPGKDGASATLKNAFDKLLTGTFVFVQEDGAIYAKPKSGSYASGNRIVLIASGSGGLTDGIFSNLASAVAVGNWVSKSGAANQVVLADATDATLPAFGVVIDVIDTTTCVVREFGDAAGVTGGGAFTPGATVYLSETAGAATTTPPATAGSIVQKIGIAKNATDVIVGITPSFNGGFYAQNGVPAQPSISFVNDPDCGFYRFGANAIGLSLAGSLYAGFTPTATAIYQQASTTGTPTAFTVQTASLTGVTAATPVISALFNLGHTVTWDAGVGPIDLQPEMFIKAPTYTAAGGPLVIDNAFTFAIGNAPVQGPNVAIGNRWTGGFFVSSSVVGDYENALLYSRSVDGGVGAAGVGIRNVYRLANDAGNSVNAGFVGAKFSTSAAAAASDGSVEIVPVFAGSAFSSTSAGLRVRALAASLVNGIEVQPATAAAAVTTGGVVTPYGSSVDVSIAIAAKGTGRTMLRNAANTITVLGTEVVGSAGQFGVVAQSASPSAGLSPITASAQSGRVTFTDNATTFVITNTLVTTDTQVYVNAESIDAGVFIQTARATAANTITITTSGVTLGLTVTFFLVNPAT